MSRTDKKLRIKPISILHLEICTVEVFVLQEARKLAMGGWCRREVTERKSLWRE